MDFVPTAEEEPPEHGRVVELVVPNPHRDAEAAAHREVLARNPFAESSVVEAFAPNFATPPQELRGADELCIASTQLMLVVGYPFDGSYAVAVDAPSPSGFTRAELFRAIVRVHTTMYEGVTLSPRQPKLQTRVDSPRFGVAWHRLEELVVERVTVDERDGRTYAWISLGS